jgi:hypothetical protein
MIWSAGRICQERPTNFADFAPNRTEEKPFMTLGSNWLSSLVVGTVENADIVVVSGVTVTAAKSDSRAPVEETGVKSLPVGYAESRRLFADSSA